MASFSVELQRLTKTADYGKKELMSDLHAAAHSGVRGAAGDYVAGHLRNNAKSNAGRLGAGYVGGMIGDTAADVLVGEPAPIEGHPFLTPAATYLGEAALKQLADESGVNFGSLPVRSGALAAGGELLGRSAVRAYDEGVIPSPIRPAASALGGAAGQLLGVPGSVLLGALARKILGLRETEPLPFDPVRAGVTLGAAGGAALGDYISAGFTGDASLRDALITGAGAGTGAYLAHSPGGGPLTGATPGALAGTGLAHLVNKLTGSKKEKTSDKKTYREYSST